MEIRWCIEQNLIVGRNLKYVSRCGMSPRVNCFSPLLPKKHKRFVRPRVLEVILKSKIFELTKFYSGRMRKLKDISANIR